MKSKQSNFVAFDIGSSKIAAIGAYVSKHGEIKINSQILNYSEGFKSGVITDMELAENSIINAIYELEQESDKSIKDIDISLSGANVKSYYVSHKISLGNQAISKQDLKKLINKALSEFKIQGQEIIHYFPIEFIIDDNQKIDNPLGLYAKELKCQLHIISANHLMITNLNKCLTKCHIEINSITVSIYASALACLSKDEQELGAIIIDMGSHTTSFAVFLNGKILYVNYIPVGSSDITTDIAKAFSVSLSLADRLKILYGNASTDLSNKNTTIRLDNFEAENNYNSGLSITIGDLGEIIRPKIKDIFVEIKKKCDHLSMDHLLSRRVVITGGGSALAGIKNLASEVFEKQVRIAKPDVISGFVENHNPCIYSTVVGMVKSKALKSFRPDYNESNSWLKRKFLWLKENI